MTTGERIAHLRNNLSLSQPALADKLNVSQSTIAMWEKNKRNVNNDDILKLAELFNVTTDYLLGNTPIKYANKNNEEKKVELTDDDVIMTYEGRPIPPDDLELIKRLLRGK